MSTADKKWTAPNVITGVRILSTIALLFTEPFSLAFFIIYSIAGVTDVLDGFVARLTKSTSDFGAKLDSVADLLMYGVMAVKVLPRLIKTLSTGLWILAIIVLAVRVSAYIVAAIKYKKFASLHTYLNKLTGFMVFILPYFLAFGTNTAIIPFCWAMGAVAAYASLEELIIHIFSKEYRANKNKTETKEEQNLQGE